MHTKSRHTKVIDLSIMRASRVIAEARAALDINTAEAAVDLARRIGEQLADEPVSLMRRRNAVVAHDLEALIDLLHTELETLADELRAVNRHTSAATAYTRVADTRRP